MLVLTRKVDQKVMIGDALELVIIEIRGDKVRLGFKGPKSIQIYREEVYDKIQERGKEVKK